MYANYPKVKELPKNKQLRRGTTIAEKGIKKLRKGAAKGEEDMKAAKGGRASKMGKGKKRLRPSPDPERGSEDDASLVGAIRPPENHDWKETPLYK